MKTLILKCSIISALFFFFVCPVSEKSKEAAPWEPGYEGKPSNYEIYIRVLEDDESQLLPIYFNWKDLGGFTPAKNQGKCSTCWAFAAVAAVESKIKIFYGEEYDLSEQQIISCEENSRNDPCNRAGTTHALQFYLCQRPILEKTAPYKCLCSDGIECCPETAPFCADIPCNNQLPYKGVHFYNINMDCNPKTIHQKIRQIKLSIMRHGPAVAGIKFCTDFFNWWKNSQSGAIYCATCSSDFISHNVLLLGWDDRSGAFLCKNSWGKEGPEGDGTFWLVYPDQISCNKCVIDAVSNISIVKIRNRPINRTFPKGASCVIRTFNLSLGLRAR